MKKGLSRCIFLSDFSTFPWFSHGFPMVLARRCYVFFVGSIPASLRGGLPNIAGIWAATATGAAAGWDQLG
jgi:hypothetical protein